MSDTITNADLAYIRDCMQEAIENAALTKMVEYQQRSLPSSIDWETGVRTSPRAPVIVPSLRLDLQAKHADQGHILGAGVSFAFFRPTMDASLINDPAIGRFEPCKEDRVLYQNEVFEVKNWDTDPSDSVWWVLATRIATTEGLPIP